MSKKRKWPKQRKKAKRGQTYTRLGVYGVQEILNRVGADEGKKLLDGHLVNMDSSRLMCFKLHGTSCTVCGIAGERFALELATHSDVTIPHLNLYAIDEVGDEVLLTKDHKVPVACGGSNLADNLQPMCIECNGLRGKDVHVKDGRVYVFFHNNVSGGKAISIAVDAGRKVAEVEGNKIVCRLTNRQFNRAITENPDEILTMDPLGEVALVFRPRDEWPDYFRYLPLWK